MKPGDEVCKILVLSGPVRLYLSGPVGSGPTGSRLARQIPSDGRRSPLAAVGSCLAVHLPVCLSCVCLLACLSVCLSRCAPPRTPTILPCPCRAHMSMYPLTVRHTSSSFGFLWLSNISLRVLKRVSFLHLEGCCIHPRLLPIYSSRIHDGMASPSLSLSVSPLGPSLLPVCLSFPACLLSLCFLSVLWLFSVCVFLMTAMNSHLDNVCGSCSHPNFRPSIQRLAKCARVTKKSARVYLCM